MRVGLAGENIKNGCCLQSALESAISEHQANVVLRPAAETPTTCTCCSVQDESRFDELTPGQPLNFDPTLSLRSSNKFTTGSELKPC